MDGSQLIADIKQNSITHGSIPFWSWNDKLNPKELRRQINVMNNLGMKGFFMHARGGLDTEYLSEDWYDCIRQCVDEAKKLGMEAWSYDENGWPSGFAGGKLLENPANHALYLTCNEDDPNAKILGEYDIDGKRYVIRRKADASYVDTMSADITRKFIAETHEQYKEKVGFSKNMPGFFTDEPQYYRWATPWSDTMPDEFMNHYGYSVFDGLAALFVDYDGADKFRYDYYKLCHELFINNFIKLLYDWCEENGCRITGHAVEESSLSGQMWCCGGVMPFYEYEHIPGIDYLGRGLASDLAPKQIGSACAQLGKKEVLSEMFACCGWDVTPLELKRIAELQYAGGVNMMCQHLYSYSIRGQRKRDYPAHYSEHLPWQGALKDFNRYFNNLGYVLSLGTESVNTLVIHPIHSAYMKYKRPQDAASIAELQNKTFELSNLLSQNQIPYHYGDENMMAKMASVKGNKLTVGLCEYEYVIIPFSYTLDGTTAALLKQYIENGGKVWIYSDKPYCIDGRISDMSWLESNTDFETIKSAAEASLTVDGNSIPALRQQVRNLGSGRLIYAVNLDIAEYKNVKLTIKNCSCASILDMDTLEYRPVECAANPDGSLTVILDFGKVQSYIIVENIDSGNYIKPEASLPIKLKNEFIFSELPKNALTLDYAQISYDGVNYEPLRPIVHVKDLLFEKRYSGELWLKYSFDVSELPESLHIAAEPLEYVSFKVNGYDITLNGDWWLDRSFRTADIAKYVRIGINEVTMSLNYFQRDYVYYVLYGGVSESLRNCLNFDTEIESIYLYGNFALKTDKLHFKPSERRSICYDGKFSIIRQKSEIDITDIVEDGYPFFGGTIDVETVYDYKSGMGTLLSLNGRFALADVCVNGKSAGQLMFSSCCELKPFLNEGCNIIKLKLYNSNRNLLGPHHRHDPEPYGVGPATFSFEKEWHDEKCPSYTDRYAFVRFGLDL